MFDKWKCYNDISLLFGMYLKIKGQPMWLPLLLYLCYCVELFLKCLNGGGDAEDVAQEVVDVSLVEVVVLVAVGYGVGICQ